MIKKLLFVYIFITSVTVFAQKQNTIDKLSMSPNPFYTATTVSFESKKQQPVTFIVKNILGKTVFKKRISAFKGIEKISFNRNDLKSGVYIYAIKNETEFISKRFMIK